MAYGNYINGRWVKSAGGRTFRSLNPANSKSLGVFQKSNGKDVNRAVTAAKRAYEKWRLVPAPERGGMLLEISARLKKNKRRLGSLVTQEMGKQLSEGLGDVQEAIDVFEYMAGEGRRLFGHTTPSELRNKFACTIRMPLGPVGLITPWNFPIAIPAWKIAPALICGNTIVFKPATDTPRCAVELAKLMDGILPKGVLNLVTGNGREVGAPIVRHPGLRALSFTGSRAVGEFVIANAGVKKVGLELGGKNPIIIMDDADLDLAVDGVIWGAFGTTGQRCTAASRVIVHKNVHDAFVKKLCRRIPKLSIGDGHKCDIGPLVNEAAVEKVDDYVKIGRKERAKLVCGGSRIKGNFYELTVFTNVKPSMRIAQEEIFGPVLSVLKAKGLDDAIAIANDSDYGLSTAIYTQDVNNAFVAIRDLDAGLTYVNSSTIGSEVHLPFGGTKKTGNGTREAGILGIEEFSETKTVYIDYSGILQKAQGIK